MDQSRRKLCAGAAAGIGVLLCGGAIRAQGVSPNAKERVIKVTAKRFAYTPNQITIRKGESVVLEFTAVDFTHGFHIPDMNIRADLVQGQVTRVRLTPDKSGVHDFLCDNFCGNGHEDMNGKIIVMD